MFSHLFEKVRPFRPIYLHVESGERNPAWKHQRAETCLSKLWNLFIAIVLPVTCLLIGLLAGVWLQNNKAWPLGCEQMYCKQPEPTHHRDVSMRDAYDR